MNFKYLYLFLIFFSLVSCVTIAPPSPLVTFGGPEITAKQSSEAAIGVGTAAALFDGSHTGATGYFGRFKYGISEKIDLGIDFAGASRNNGQYLGLKIATRYQLTDYSRLEFAIGGADDSSGKSLNTDLAYTIGTIKDRPWNFYTSARVSYIHGFASDVISLPGQNIGDGNSIAPPNTVIAILNLGAQGRINENQRIIFEGGYGYIFPENLRKGPTFYISTGLVFNFGKK